MTSGQYSQVVQLSRGISSGSSHQRNSTWPRTVFTLSLAVVLKYTKVRLVAHWKHKRNIPICLVPFVLYIYIYIYIYIYNCLSYLKKQWLVQNLTIWIILEMGKGREFLVFSIWCFKISSFFWLGHWNIT